MRTNLEKQKTAYAKSNACEEAANSLTRASIWCIAYLPRPDKIDDQIEFYRRWSNRWARFAEAVKG